MRGKLNFSFSLHYIELKRRGWIEKFFDNFNYVRQAGSSVVLQMNLCDEYVKTSLRISIGLSSFSQ